MKHQVTPNNRIKPTRQIYERTQFRTILMRERAMVLRNGHHFCLLVIALCGGSPARQARTRLRLAVLQRMRQADVVGWLDARTLGIILPHTSVRHAEHLASNLTSELSDLNVKIESQTHRCPSGAEGDSGEEAALSPADPMAAQNSVTTLLFAQLPPWKRAFDILFALASLISVLPILVLITIAIRLVSPGPPIFHQKRIGLLGVPFMCHKFRSMRTDSDTEVHHRHVEELVHQNSPLTKLDTSRDARLIPLGRLLRASGLDELPQLFNVLRGEMSVVGPRPCIPYEYAMFNAWQRERNLTPPGITGLWQVSGKNDTTFRKMMQLDVLYVGARSLPHDLAILARTPIVPLKQLWQCVSTQFTAPKRTHKAHITTEGVPT